MMPKDWVPIATVEELVAAERYAMDVKRIPQSELIERAAEAVAQQIGDGERVLVLCGSGCNGADAVACGRILMARGITCDFVVDMYGTSCAAFEEQWERLTCRNREIVTFSFREEGTAFLPESYTVIVDGVFGIGLNRSVGPELAALFQRINSSTKRPKVIAIDTPSGIHGTTGEVLGEALYADTTVTFSYNKVGLLRYPGRAYAGTILVEPVGIPDEAPKPERYVSFEKGMCAFPKRNPAGHKGTFGKAMIYAGCEEMPGAASLCAKACYRSGVGLVKVVSEPEALRTMHVLVPEAIGEERAHYNPNTADGYSVIVVGPGLGNKESAEGLLWSAIKSGKKLVIDADGVNLLAKRLNEVDLDCRKRIEVLNRWLPEQTILTPHLRELSRLLAIPEKELLTNRMTYETILRERLHFVLVWKDACTTVYGGPHKCVFVNSTGNDALATAGSGDVLAGVCGAFAAVCPSAFEAACKAVYVHGAAGDLCRREIGAYGTMASDVIDAIAKVMN